MIEEEEKVVIEIEDPQGKVVIEKEDPQEKVVKEDPQEKVLLIDNQKVMFPLLLPQLNDLNFNKLKFIQL